MILKGDRFFFNYVGIDEEDKRLYYHVEGDDLSLSVLGHTGD